MSCARVLVLIEPYVDGELTQGRHARVAAHLETCVACTQALHAAQRVQQTLHALPMLQAPAEVRARLQAALPSAEPSVAAAAAAPPERHWQDVIAAGVSRLWDALLGRHEGATGWLRPVGALAVAVLLVVVWALQRPSQPTSQEPVYSQQELLEAEYQARWALAYLARITAGAGDTAFLQIGDVMGTVIGTHVMGSVTDAVDRSLEPRSEPKEPSTLEEEVQSP